MRMGLVYGDEMRNWLKTVLFVSALSPTLLVVGGVRWYESGVLDIVVIQLILVSLIGSILPFLIILCLVQEAESLAFNAKKIESADYFLIVFVVGYLIPVVAKFAEIGCFYFFLLFVVCVFIAWLISNIPSHPLMYIFKYRFYKVESEEGVVYILISRRNILSPKSIKLVKRISSGMLLE